MPTGLMSTFGLWLACLLCRLGGNYLMLPVNAPKCAHHNNHHDGVMNFMQRGEEVGAALALLGYI